MNDLFVVDTSVVIERAVSRLIKKKEIMGTIIIPNAVVAELEHQANKGQETGLMGIEELQNLQELKKQNLQNPKNTRKKKRSQKNQSARLLRASLKKK